MQASSVPGTQMKRESAFVMMVASGGQLAHPGWTLEWPGKFDPLAAGHDKQVKL
jgi:hypothetical protein